MVVAAALALATLGSATVALGARAHRLFMPPPETLATTLQADEDEWSIILSRPTVAADANGMVSFAVANRGEDDHDFALRDSDGRLRMIELGPGGHGALDVRLSPGRHKVYCTLPGHEQLGMVAHLDVTDSNEVIYAAWEATLERMIGPIR